MPNKSSKLSTKHHDNRHAQFCRIFLHITQKSFRTSMLLKFYKMTGIRPQAPMPNRGVLEDI